jgi:DNA-binding beta-propeller fold protein YncE
VSPNYVSGSISRILNPTSIPVSNGTITSDQFTSPDGEVFVKGELFVAQVASSNVLRFKFDASGNTSFNGTITDGLCCGAPRNVAVSPAGNELFVTECCGVNEVNRYLLDLSGIAVRTGHQRWWLKQPARNGF